MTAIGMASAKIGQAANGPRAVAIAVSAPWLVAGPSLVAIIRWVRRKLGWRWLRRARNGAPPA